MSLKRLNREFRLVFNKNNQTIKQEDEYHLNFSLREELKSMKEGDINESSIELPTLISNVHKIITICDPKSEFFWQTIDLVGKIIQSLKDKTERATNLRLLPLLTEALTKSSSKSDCLLKLIEEISFNIKINVWEPFVEKLIHSTVDIILDDKSDIKKTALSVLINLCNKNMPSLKILNCRINFVDLQKKVQSEKFGFMAYKLVLVLNDCGHRLHESDVRNFLKSTLIELERIQMLDDQLLLHLVEFLNELSQRPNTKDTFQKFDFRAGIEPALLALNKIGPKVSSHKANGLLRVLQTILRVKSISLKPLVFTILNFALDNLKSNDCQVQALDTLAFIFEYDPEISTADFNFDETKASLITILENSKQASFQVNSCLKLVAVLAECLRINLLTQKHIDGILGKLIGPENLSYFDLDSVEISMYLQCLVTISTLTKAKLLDESNIYQNVNVEELIGMAIKHGNCDQRVLALELVEKTSKEAISKIISSSIIRTDAHQSEVTKMSETFVAGNDTVSKFDKNRIDKLLLKLETACEQNKFQSIKMSEMIEMYSHQISLQDEFQSTKVHSLSEELTIKYRENFRLKLALKHTEKHWLDAEKLVETLTNDKKQSEASVLSLREELKALKRYGTDNAKQLSVEKRKACELEKKVEQMEDDIKRDEELRLAVLNIMSKRTKNENNKEN